MAKICLLLSEIVAWPWNVFLLPNFLGYWNYLREKLKLKQTRPPCISLLFLSSPVFLLQYSPCGLDSFLAAWVRYQSLFSLCDSIYSVTYPLFENREFPYFHPLLYCHHKYVFSLFASSIAPSDRSSRSPEVPAGVFLVVVVKSVTVLEALLILEDVHSIPKLRGPFQNQPARCWYRWW